VLKHSIVVVDDNEAFLESTEWLLTGMGYTVSGFNDPEKALEVLDSKNEFDCVLVDVRMPKFSGLDLHDTIIEKGLTTPVIYMTGHGDVALAVEAMKKGAITFLEKPLSSDALSAALILAMEIRERRKSSIKDENKVIQFKKDLKKLTPREEEVMHFIVDGKANKVIAFDLGISQKTVELHRSRVMKKLPIRSSQELVKLVMLSQ